MSPRNDAPGRVTGASKKAQGFMAVCRVLGSLQVAIPLIIILACLLVFGTFLESNTSTEKAQEFIYTSWWFDLYLLIFALNVSAVVVTRYPFKKRHAGFIITHAGILIVILGAALNRHLGIEGQMLLNEGEASGYISLTDKVLQVRLPDRRTVQISADARRVKRKLGKALSLGEHGYEAVFLDAHEKMVPDTTIRAGRHDVRNPAVHFELKSETAGFQEDKWLLYFNEKDPDSAVWSLGPATFKLFKAVSDEETASLLAPAVTQPDRQRPELLILRTGTEKPERITFNPDVLGTFDLSGSIARVRIIEYLPNARVVDNRLMNDPDASPNPAVRLELIGPEGQKEQHTAFAFFPEFDTRHGSDEKGWSGIKLQLNVSGVEPERQAGLAQFVFVQGTDTRLFFSSETTRGGYATGEVEVGAWQDAGWMDFTFRVKDYIPYADVEHRLVPLDPEKNRASDRTPVEGIQIRIQKKSPGGDIIAASDPIWLSFGRGQDISLGGERATVVYYLKTAPVPFSLRLVDFRRIFYPGTRSPAAYESDVVLHDHDEGLTREQKIYMNHPLDYKGYRVFQSSFVEVPPGAPEISIFQIAKAPGTNIIYAGTIVMILGIVTMFYVRPFSTARISQSPSNTESFL